MLSKIWVWDPGSGKNLFRWYVAASVSDPGHFNADPDTSFHFNAGPDPHPTFHLKADPYPVPHYSVAIWLVYRPSMLHHSIQASKSHEYDPDTIGSGSTTLQHTTTNYIFRFLL